MTGVAQEQRHRVITFGTSHRWDNKGLPPVLQTAPTEARSHSAQGGNGDLLFHKALVKCCVGEGELTAQRHMQLLCTVFAQLCESVSLGDVIHRPWPTVNKTVELDS